MEAEEIKIATAEERQETAAEAAGDPGLLEDLLELLRGTSRSKRQRAAATLAVIAANDPDVLADAVDDLVEAVDRPEDQTRWEALNALANMVEAGEEVGMDAVAVAEDALFDEKSGIVRESAFRFLCAYGSCSPEESDTVWPSLDEAIQCYHGNEEFTDMLNALVEFAEGDISLETSRALAARMKFDAEMARGTLRKRSEQIVESNKRREEAEG